MDFPELDAIITGTVNTAKVDRRPLLAAIVQALDDYESPSASYALHRATIPERTFPNLALGASETPGQRQ